MTLIGLQSPDSRQPGRLSSIPRNFDWRVSGIKQIQNRRGFEVGRVRDIEEIQGGTEWIPY
jgi:hypothetical protein